MGILDPSSAGIVFIIPKTRVLIKFKQGRHTEVCDRRAAGQASTFADAEPRPLRSARSFMRRNKLALYLFYKLMWPLQFYVNQQCQILPHLDSLEVYYTTSCAPNRTSSGSATPCTRTLACWVPLPPRTRPIFPLIQSREE